MEDKGTTAGARDICERTLDYAVRAIKLCRTLQAMRTGAGDVVGKQYLRSATSIGANVSEAQAAESRADFVHKYRLALKEARESLYWLHVLERSELVAQSRLSEIVQETDELVAIITTIVRHARENAEGPGRTAQ